MFFGNNVFAMIDPQYLVSTLFLKKIDRTSWPFDGSEIEIENGYKSRICAKLLDNLAQEFVAEMKDHFYDIEISQYSNTLIQAFMCNNGKDEIKAFKDYCEMIVYFCESNQKINLPKEQYYNAISFVFGFLKMQPGDEIEIFDISFLHNEFTKKIAEFFDRSIRNAIVQELFIREVNSIEQYLEIARRAEFNDPRFMSFVIKLANNLALLALEKLSKIEAS